MIIDGVIDLGNIAPQDGSWKFVGEESSDFAGITVVAVGDIGGDGHTDFVIGAPFQDRDEIPYVGAAYLVSICGPWPKPTQRTNRLMAL